MPMKVKLEAALRALGLTLETVNWDHDPPLQMRVWVPEKNDTIPAANDPAFIVPLEREEHRAKTSGGKTKARAQGDQTEIARTKNMADTQEEFRRRILAKEPGKKPERKSKWPSRPFGGKKKERKE
jgi:hypothetical protein